MPERKRQGKVLQDGRLRGLPRLARQSEIRCDDRDERRPTHNAATTLARGTPLAGTRVTVTLEVESVERRRYPDMATILHDDETALLTVWQAHTSVRCRCPDDGNCEARQALEDTIGTIQVLLDRQG